MFTGIIESCCPVLSLVEGAGRRQLVLDLSLLRETPVVGAAPPTGGSAAQLPPSPQQPVEPQPLDQRPLAAVGDSVAIDGVCLTVSRLEGDSATFDVITETLERTTLGGLEPGDRCNVERALRFGDRVDGHLVQGHVEGTGLVDGLVQRPGEVRLGVSCGAAFASRCLPKGSVTLQGVSLTVAELGSDRLVVALVPHTLRITSLGRLAVGDPINLEADLIGQWVMHTVRTQGAEGWSGFPSAGN